MTIDCQIKNHVRNIVEATIVELRQEVIDTSIFKQSYLNREQAAQYLSCSKATIDNYARWGYLPRLKLGRSSKFRVADLDSLLTNPKTA